MWPDSGGASLEKSEVGREKSSYGLHFPGMAAGQPRSLSALYEGVGLLLLTGTILMDWYLYS